MSFLYNSWYCAGWSGDLKTDPIGIKLLDQELVLYRKQDGAVVCLTGICPHRFAPLWRGAVVGDAIRCGYHGLEFGAEGRCIRNPHGSGAIAPGAHIRAYPVVEKSGAIWVWMGDPESLDESQIVAFDFVEDRTRWSGTTGYLRINANYQLVIDNLLDLTHSAYIHVNTVGVSADDWIGETKMEYNFHTDGRVINSDYIFRNSPPTPLFALFAGKDVGDVHVPMALHPASSLILDLTMTDLGQPKNEGVHMPSAHLLAPETESTCHYFYAISRSEKLGDDKITAAMGEIVRRAFVDEDAPMIQDVQGVMGDRDFFRMQPLILETDKAAVYARRTLAKLIRQERSPTDEGPATAEKERVEANV